MSDEDEAVIYGAQAVAYSTFRALSRKGLSIKCFVVTEKKGNPDNLGKLPVLSWAEYVASDGDTVQSRRIYIATPDSGQSEIMEVLMANGCRDIVPVTSDVFGNMMAEYYRETGSFKSLTDISLYQRVCIYQAVHEKDKKLSHVYVNAPWIRPIQVGSATAGQRFEQADILHDDEGENISCQNFTFSELTALYWAWKNSSAEVIGLAHYRRLLDIKEDDLWLLLDNHLDVILPQPMLYSPSACEHHIRWVKDEHWQAVMRALSELYPDYAVKTPQILSKETFYNYNIFCARRNVVLDYCKWLFSIFHRAIQYIENTSNEALYRSMGYVGESLCDIYFMYNKNKYRVAHTTVLMRT